MICFQKCAERFSRIFFIVLYVAVRDGFQPIVFMILFQKLTFVFQKPPERPERQDRNAEIIWDGENESAILGKNPIYLT